MPRELQLRRRLNEPAVFDQARTILPFDLGKVLDDLLRDPIGQERAAFLEPDPAVDQAELGQRRAGRPRGGGRRRDMSLRLARHHADARLPRAKTAIGSGMHAAPHHDILCFVPRRRQRLNSVGIADVPDMRDHVAHDRPLHRPGDQDRLAFQRNDEDLRGEIALMVEAGQIIDILRVCDQVSVQSTLSHERAGAVDAGIEFFPREERGASHAVLASFIAPTN